MPGFSAARRVCAALLGVKDMKFSKMGLLGLAVVAVLAWGANADAGTLTYKFGFDQTNYKVAAGGTVNVGVYLQETGSTGDPFVLAPTGVGLTGPGVTVTYPSGGVA